MEDRRGMPVRGLAFGGGIGSVVLLVLYMLMGGDPGVILNQAPAPQRMAPPGPEEQQRNDEGKRFVSVVLADTEDVWSSLFKEQLQTHYREPKLVLFTNQVDSACGIAGSAVGPFYCPNDEKVYLDLGFFDELRRRFRAPGDFAAAYVIAHEVGHHVQKQLGVMDRAQGRRESGRSNQASVRMELQADFLAGVWAHHAQRSKQIIEAGDIEEAINAASAIGDDRLQRRSQGYVVPDAFTHGSSAQRVRWFKRGYETGDVSLMSQLFELPYDQL